MITALWMVSARAWIEPATGTVVAPDSPLVAMTSRGALNAAKAGGIGGLSD